MHEAEVEKRGGGSAAGRFFIDVAVIPAQRAKIECRVESHHLAML
jgi:hypothetical protein